MLIDQIPDDMELTYIQLLYVGVLAVNLIMVTILLIKTRKSKIDPNKNHGRNNNDNNDEGGLEADFDPVLDLPPGVVLPIDSPVKEREPVS